MMNKVELELGTGYMKLEEHESGVRFNVRTTDMMDILQSYDTYRQKGTVVLDGVEYNYVLVVVGTHATILDTWVIDLIIPEHIQSH